jgi:hypothetical protein
MVITERVAGQVREATPTNSTTRDNRPISRLGTAEALNVWPRGNRIAPSPHVTVGVLISTEIATDPIRCKKLPVLLRG